MRCEGGIWRLNGELHREKLCNASSCGNALCNVPDPPSALPRLSTTPHPRTRMNASVPTLYKINHNITRDFFLTTKLLPGINLVIMKLYTEVKLYDAIIACQDGMPMREASRMWHIPHSTFRDRLYGIQNRFVAADP